MDSIAWVHLILHRSKNVHLSSRVVQDSNPIFNIHFAFCFIKGVNNCICKPFTCRKFAVIHLTIRYNTGTHCCSVRKVVLCEIIIESDWLSCVKLLSSDSILYNSCKLFVFCYSKNTPSEYFNMLYYTSNVISCITDQ